MYKSGTVGQMEDKYLVFVLFLSNYLNFHSDWTELVMVAQAEENEDRR